jgi:hypothetical protein
MEFLLGEREGGRADKGEEDSGAHSEQRARDGAYLGGSQPWNIYSTEYQAPRIGVGGN